MSIISSNLDSYLLPAIDALRRTNLANDISIFCTLSLYVWFRQHRFRRSRLSITRLLFSAKRRWESTVMCRHLVCSDIRRFEVGCRSASTMASYLGFLLICFLSGTALASIGPVTDIHVVSNEIAPDGFTRPSVFTWC